MGGREGGRITLYGCYLTSLVSSIREISALLNVGKMPLLPRLLSGGRVLPFGWDVRVEDTGVVVFFAPETGQSSLEFPSVPVLGGREGGVDECPGRRLEQLGQYQALCGEVTRIVEQVENLGLEVGRGEIRLQGMGPGAGPERLRGELETNFLDSAHLVFTTLNTAGMPSVCSGNKFTVVVVDEAAQAIEPSTLIPLQTGAQTCVLVGDPQQLPATVFSSLGASTAFERSLFERLEHGGHPVHLLDTQYRMHPLISAFPRLHFYGALLKDGENVFSPSYTRPWHTLPPFQPFTFLNLRSDTDRGAKGGGGGGGGGGLSSSYRNTAEARLIVNVYQTLKREGGREVKGKVGVITPYQAQLLELNSQFARALGPGYLEEVELNTVDGYQGKEKDIILFSCVRAGGKKGIGFLADVRRMNVGLTRGRLNVLVVGRAETLQQNKHWRALLEHAKRMGAFVSISHPGCNLLAMGKAGEKGREGGRGREQGRGGSGRGGGGRGRGSMSAPRRGQMSLAPPGPLPSPPPSSSSLSRLYPPTSSGSTSSLPPGHPPAAASSSSSSSSFPSSASTPGPPPASLPPPSLTSSSASVRSFSPPPIDDPIPSQPSSARARPPPPLPQPNPPFPSRTAISYSPPPSLSPPLSPPRRRARIQHPPNQQQHHYQQQQEQQQLLRDPPPPPNPYLMMLGQIQQQQQHQQQQQQEQQPCPHNPPR